MISEMNKNEPVDRILAMLKQFSIAFWVLAIVGAIDIAVHIFGPMPFLSNTPQMGAWNGQSVEAKISQSTVILLTENRQDQGKLKAVIKEILKRKDGTEFNYAVGDDFPELSITPKEQVSYGEGAVVLLAGSPAMM